MSSPSQEDSVLSKLDAAAAPLAKFDAFPKVPSAYKTRSESRGFITVFVMLIAFVLMLNDIGEYIWGWPEYRFAVDQDKTPFLNINLDMVVNMPCKCEFAASYTLWVIQVVDIPCLKDLTIDLRDVMGDRLLLSGGLRRDGVGSP
jgi:hypothetical protein